MCCSTVTEREYNRAGWGLLAILWGFTILFDFMPFGAGLVGTGLILLGVHAVRAVNSKPTRSDNVTFGILALTWGGLEFARPLLERISPSADWDWGIFALLLVTFGAILLVRALMRAQTEEVKNSGQRERQRN